MDIKATVVFQKTWDALYSNYRFIVSEGGSRSSKTYSLCQAIILYCLQTPKTAFSVVRATFPALRGSIMRDFFEILNELNLYDVNYHSKTEHIYRFPNGSFVEFFSADDQQKLRGRKRDFCLINEANELDYDSFQQLNLRTTKKMLVDYNPSAPESYLYHLPEEKTIKIHSTYKDNPFLPKETIEEIESYKYRDEDYYTIFALGQRAFSKENVFSQWKTLDTKPPHLTEKVYGIDFGYTHPTGVVEVNYSPTSNEVFIRELLYESYLTSGDLIKKLNDLGVDKRKPWIADYARPEIIQDMKRAGFSMYNAIKDVRDGIMNVKSFNISIDAKSTNIQNENLSYRYKKINGVLTEEPSKINDDLMDAIRYALFYVKKYCLKSADTYQVYKFTI